MPTPLPRNTPQLSLPTRGYAVAPSKAAPFAPKPPAAPRGTTEGEDQRAQNLALQLWASQISELLDKYQTSILEQQPPTSSAGSTTSAGFTTTLTGSSVNTGPVVDSAVVIPPTLFPLNFALTVVVTATLTSGVMSYRVKDSQGNVIRGPGDNFGVINAGATSLRMSAASNFQCPTADYFVFEAMYRATSGTANFDLRQIYVCSA